MPTCTTASLTNGCFIDPVMSEKMRLAFKVWYLSNELAYLGGTNYLNDFQGLFNASNAVFEKMDMNTVSAAELIVFYNNAVTAGSPVTAVPNTEIGNVQKSLGLDTNDLEKIKVFLECRLGAHRSPPA